jgi:hypothetical protein
MGSAEWALVTTCREENRMSVKKWAYRGAVAVGYVAGGVLVAIGIALESFYPFVLDGIAAFVIATILLARRVRQSPGRS